MWLASVSCWPDGRRNLPLERWGAGRARVARRIVDQLLDGCGDPAVERGFAMVMTMCAHRAVSDAELTAIPAAGDVFVTLAGGGVRTLWQTDDYPHSASLDRCERGVWWTKDGIRVPGDCGECPPCLARAMYEAVKG